MCTDDEGMQQTNEEEAYVHFTMMEINDFIKRYGTKFVYERLSESNQKELVAFIKDVPWAD